MLLGVLYGAEVAPCATFGYVDLAPPFTHERGARATDLSPVDMRRGVLGSARYIGTSLRQPIHGVSASDLEHRALTFQVLMPGR